MHLNWQSRSWGTETSLIWNLSSVERHAGLSPGFNALPWRKVIGVRLEDVQVGLANS